MSQLYTDIEIDAPVNVVWEILSDFNNYDAWNSYTFNLTLPSENPEKFIDDTFQLDVQITENKIIEKRDLILFEFSPEKHTIRWGGKQFGIKTNRVQLLEKLSDNRTKYVNYEDFNGLLSKIPIWLYGDGMLSGMKRVCNELEDQSLQRKV